MADGGKAVGIFNTSDTYQTITLNRNENGLQGLTKMRDAWRQKDIIATGNTYSVKVAPHGVMLVRFSK
jgi:alpha-galactosidase